MKPLSLVYLIIYVNIPQIRRLRRLGIINSNLRQLGLWLYRHQFKDFREGGTNIKSFSCIPTGQPVEYSELMELPLIRKRGAV